MRHSRFLQVSHRDAVVAVYHSLNPVPFFVAKEDWDNHLAGNEQEEIIAALVDTGLIATEQEDEEKIRAVVSGSSFPDTMSILYLVLTKRCNFRCRQCFQPERRGEARTDEPLMSHATAKAAVDQFVRHVAMSVNEPLEPQIQFYGGEPFTNWNTFAFAVTYARERMSAGELPEDTKLVVVTNGSLVTKERAEFMAANGVAVGLSVDGPRHLNERYRVLANGGGTYDLITQALAHLKDAGVAVSLSITITPAMVSDLPGIIRWAHEEMGVQATSFNLIGDSSLERLGEMGRAEYAAKAAEGMVAAHKLARHLGVVEDRMERKVNDFADGVFKYVDCGALGNQLVVNPDGSVAYCHANENYVIGHVEDSELNMFEAMRDHEWRHALPIHNDRCLDCSAIAVCGYGCFHHAVDRGLRVEDGDDVHCQHTKAAMEYMLWSLYDAMQHRMARHESSFLGK